MAVLQDAISTAAVDNTAGGTSFTGTINLTVGSGLSNGYLTVRLAWEGAAVSAISVHWDSTGTNQVMTQVGLATNASGLVAAAIFGLVNPTAGLKTLNVTWTGSASEIFVVGESWTGVDPVTPTSSVQTSNNITLAASAALTLTAITSATGNECIGAYSNNFTWASTNQTQEFVVNGTHGAAAFNRAAGAASVTLSATNGTHASTAACGVGCNLNAAAGGPAGDQSYDTPPAWRDRYVLAGAQWRTWSNQNLLLNTLVPRACKFEPWSSGWSAGWGPCYPAGVQVVDLPASQVFDRVPHLRTWIDRYKLTLIGQDKLPTGDQSFALPASQTVSWQPSFQTPNLLVTTLSPVGLPPGKQAFARTPDPQDSWAPLRGFADSYNLTLVGQDQLPVGDQRYDRQPDPQDAFAQWRSWTWQYRQLLAGQDTLPVGEQTNYLPTGISWQPYTLPPNLLATTLFAVSLPPGEQAYARSIDPQDAAAQWRSWTSSYNLSLIGQDQLPVGRQLNYLPAGITWQPDSPPQNLQNTLYTGPPAVLPPGKQFYDLPPRVFDAFAQWRAFAGWRNFNLVSQDQLPPGQQTNYLPFGIGGQQPPYSAPPNLLNILLQVVTLPPGQQTYALAPSQIAPRGLDFAPPTLSPLLAPPAVPLPPGQQFSALSPPGQALVPPTTTLNLIPILMPPPTPGTTGAHWIRPHNTKFITPGSGVS